MAKPIQRIRFHQSEKASAFYTEFDMLGIGSGKRCVLCRLQMDSCNFHAEPLQAQGNLQGMA